MRRRIGGARGQRRRKQSIIRWVTITPIRKIGVSLSLSLPSLEQDEQETSFSEIEVDIVLGPCGEWATSRSFNSGQIDRPFALGAGIDRCGAHAGS
jgi:hypothetical protein